MLAVQVGVGLREFVLQREPREFPVLLAKIADYSASLLYDNRAGGERMLRQSAGNAGRFRQLVRL